MQPLTLRGAKLAIHANRVTDALYAHVEAAAAQGTPFAAVKLTQEFTGLRAVKARSPETLTVARAVAPMDGMGGVEEITDAEVAPWGDLVLVPLYQFAAANPDFEAYVNVWEFINEADPVGERGYLMLGKVMRYCVQKASADFPTLSWGVGSFNMGTPEYGEMRAFIESGVFELDNVVLCLHEGVRKPDDPINLWHSSEDDESETQNPDTGLIPGAPSVPAGGGALFGRVAYWHQLLGDEGMVPVIVTEAYLHAYGDTAEIRRRAAWVDDLYSQMWYVVGWMPFTHSPTDRWRNQDYTLAYEALIGYMGMVKDRENAVKEEEEQPVNWRLEVIEESERRQRATGINYNPTFAFIRWMVGDNPAPHWAPAHSEGSFVTSDGIKRQLQGAIDLAGKEERITFTYQGAWSGMGNVEILRRSEVEGNPPAPPPINDIADSLPKHATLRYATRQLSAIKAITIHHSGPPTTGSTTPQTIASYHVNSNGWPGIGYHYYVMGDGTIYRTNRHETISYHNGNYNTESLGICLAGDFTSVVPTPAQIAATASLVLWLREQFPGIAIRPHRAVNQTACPGATWESWWELIVGGSTPPAVSLPVPYASQWGAGAERSNGDCGPADVAMLVRYYTGQNISVDQAAIACGQPAGSSSTSIAQLVNGLAYYGIASERRSGLTLGAIRAELNAGNPIILLVHYGAITGRQDVNFTGGHFFIAVGHGSDESGFCFLINDSNFWGTRVLEGDHRKVRSEVLQAALEQAHLDGNPTFTGIVVKGPATTPPPPAGETVDLLPYLRGDGRGYMVRHPAGNEEKFRTVVDGNRFLQLKNAQYEEFVLETGHIWRGVDTSAGEGNYYRQSEAGKQTARWCPQIMSVGQTWTAPVAHTVQTFRKSNCAPVEHHRNGTATNRVTLVAKHHSRTWNGITLFDVVELRTQTGESMFFARGYGLVAWVAPWGTSAISKVLPSGEWDNQPETGCFS